MTLDENITNAMQVILKTYENVDKLMKYCKMVAFENTNYLVVEPSFKPKFLRWKSDADYKGWLTTDFIMLFQSKADEACLSGNKWRNGSVYVMEICLADNTVRVPTVFLSRFIYMDISKWSAGISATKHRLFYEPIRNQELMDISEIDQLRKSVPKNEKSSANRSVSKIYTLSAPLTKLTAENLQEEVFGAFDRLSCMT